jgi:peroxiredoxin
MNERHLSEKKPMKTSLPLLCLLGVTAAGLGCASRAYSDNTQSTAAPAVATEATTTVLNLESAVGQAAPAFALPDQENKTHSLADLKGKTVVLAFYPADMTAGCSLEARGLSGALGEFKKRGVQVFCVSVQDVNSKKQFCDKEGIKYPMLADVKRTVSHSYGVLGDNGLARRVSFIIAPDGTIAAVDQNVKPLTHAKDLLAKLDALKPALQVQTRTSAQTTPPAKVQMDKPVASFSLANYDGKNTTVGDWNANGTKATVLLFVSVQCPISNGYNERMVNLAKTYEARGVRFVGINSNKAEAPDGIAAHAKEHSFSFPVLKDTGNVIADRFEAQVTPEAYVIDDKGVLRYHGRIDNSLKQAEVKTRDLQAALDSVLAGRTVADKETVAFGCSIKRVG